MGKDITKVQAGNEYWHESREHGRGTNRGGRLDFLSPKRENVKKEESLAGNAVTCHRILIARYARAWKYETSPNCFLPILRQSLRKNFQFNCSRRKIYGITRRREKA